ncbi:MAG: LemA family protein [Clostridia bacterium]|nr:LemA family protein [Clostridia bacterium]
MTYLWITIGVIVLIIIFVFNQIVREENTAKNAFSSIDVYLKKRCDLIPNLVEVVKGSAAHEQSIFEGVAIARTNAMNAKKEKDVIASDNEVNSALKSLFAVAESYPNLKANTAFVQLQKSLNVIEDELAAARRTYNAAATEYNVTLESFPTNLIGKLFGKKKKELFAVSAEANESMKVNF